MNDDRKAVTLRALACYRGDDLERARMAFAGLSADEMRQNFGQSGKSKRVILDEYLMERATVDAAISWVKSL